MYVGSIESHTARRAPAAAAIEGRGRHAGDEMSPDAKQREAPVSAGLDTIALTVLALAALASNSNPTRLVLAAHEIDASNSPLVRMAEGAIVLARIWTPVREGSIHGRDGYPSWRIAAVLVSVHPPQLAARIAGGLDERLGPLRSNTCAGFGECP